MNPWLLTIPLAYLLGSIPFGYLLVRVFRHQDIRETGSGNIGATNVARSGAKGLGFATLLLDLAKAYAAVAFAQRLVPGDTNLAVAAAVAAIIGHVYPIWLSFQGGKGVASALGLMLALDWRGGIGIFSIFLAVVLFTHYVSLGSILGAASFPVFAFLLIPSRTPIVIGGLLFIPLLVILKHRANIARLIAGTENRFGSKKVTE
jgi:glycerol-3-phosphate acyltransferase PlsY